MKKLESFLKRKHFLYQIWKDTNSIAISTGDLNFREPYMVKKLFRFCDRHNIDVRIAPNYITMKEQIKITSPNGK